MKKIHMIAALLAMLLPMVLWAGGDSTTYYAALKAQVSSSGGGKVYASTSSSTPSSSSFGSGNTAQNSGSSSSFTFYAYAQANEGYKFKNWTGDFSSTDNPYVASVTATSTSSSSYTTKTITANFEPLPPATVTFAAPNNGSYTVNGETVNAQLVKANQAVPYSVTLVATPATNFRFAGWYVLDGGVKSFFSTDASTTKKFDVDVTVGAEFIPDGYAIYAAVAAKGYDNLATALAEAQPGESISVYSSTALDTSAAVGVGVALTVSSGATLTIASGETLYIDGSATVNGTISGTVSKCTKLIQQAGDGSINVETGMPNPYIPYDGVKYWRTTTTTPSISVSSSASHITVVNGYGNVFRTSATTAKALVCMVDMGTAANHITSIDADFSSFALAYENARQSATTGSGTSQNISGNSKLIVMLADDTSASESGEQRYGFMVDCAGCNLAFSATLKSNYDVVILNCPYTAGNQLKSTITNTRVHFFNCKKAGVKINSKNSTIVNCYDCGDLSISYDPTSVVSGEVNIYSGGPYSASFNKLWHIYGGTFKNKPSNDYLWDSTNFEVQPDGSNWKIVEKKPTVYVAYTVTGTTTTEYESLFEAIGAVVNGGTVYLMQDVELDTDLEISAGREVTIEMMGCDISGHRIVNAGVLHLEDRKMTSNPGIVSAGIVNSGTITIAYGIYTGSIQLNGGMFTVYNGTVDGSITVASSVEDPAAVANLKGGQFASRSFTYGSETKDISTICEAVESEHVVKAKDGRFRVARFPAAIVTDTGTMALSAVALGTDDSSLWTRFASAPTRANFTAAEWYRACELQSTFEYYQTQGIDCAVLVDRTVTAGTLSLKAPIVGTQPIDADILVSEFGFSALLPMIRDYPHTPRYAPWAYSTFLPGGEHSSLSFELINGNSANNGTLLIAQMRLASDIQATSGKKDYSYTQYDVIGSRKYVLNAGSNAAMIRPATGAATFYATLGAAMDAVADGGTVMLANDCDTALTLNKAGTYTFDSMGFAYSGGEPAVGSGLRIVSQTTVDSSAKVLVPDAIATTYVIENAGTIECGETKYVSIEAAVEASSDDTIAVTVTADDTETVTLPQGKTLTVTVNDGVEANVTVDPGAGAFIETTTSGSTTTYESKQITVEMEEPSAVEVVKVDHGVTNEVSDASLVNAAVHALTGNHDVSRTDNTDKLNVLDKITVMPAKIVEEVVGDKTIIRSVTFDVVPHLNAGQTLGEGQTLKFRLPVDAAATQLAAIVSHAGEQFGIYPVQAYANEKFIEVTSADFSPYGYELLDGETANPIAAIGTTGYATLDAAIAAANVGNVDEITILDSGITTSPDADWKVVGNKLVKKSYVAQIGTAKYETLNSAVSAAQSGDTITLLADITDYTGTTLVSKSLTINGAGHSITAAAVPEGEHRDMVHAFTGGTSMLKIGGGAVTVTNITFDGHATHAYTYLIEVVNSGASLTVGDISLVNGGELDNSGTPGAGYGAAIHVNNASIVVKDGFYACTGGVEYGVFPFTGILPEGDASVMFDLVEDSDDTPTVDIGGDLLLVGMIGAIDPDTAQAILDYMQVPSRFIPYTLTLGDGSDYAFTGASPRTWNDIIDYGKEIMDVSTSLGYEGLDKESTPVEVGLLTDTELSGTFVFEDANFTVNGNGHELTGTIKYTASAGELKNVVLTSDTILDISAEGAAVKFGDNVTIKAGEAVTLVVGDLSSGQTLATHVGGLSPDSVVLKTWDGDNLVDAEIPEGLVLIEVDGNLVVSAAVVQVVTDNGLTTNMYATLEEAFAAANAAGTATITILDDYTLVGNVGVTVNAGSNITLDLNGHTLSQVGPMAGAGYFIQNNGTLTLKDSTDILKNGTGNGRMTTSSANPDTGDIPSYANNLITNHGTLTIESGYYKSLTNAGYASFVVDNHSGATANITGGELSNTANYAYVVRMFLNSTTAENALNIGGTAVIEGSYAVWMQYANSNANKASLNISGGTLTATSGYAVYAGGDGYRDASNIDVSFTGGTVNGSGVWLGSDTAFKSLEVTGGTYAAFGASSSNNGFISGGTYKSTGLFNQGGRTDPYSVLADGYILTDLGNGTYGVVAGSYVAQIVTGGTTNKYVSLANAIAAVSTDGTETTITMITNSAETAVITVASGKNVVLDLNGKTVSYTTDAKSVYFITNKGTLTIVDNSANADGQILLTAQPDTGYSVENVTIYNENGTLTLVSGTIKNATGAGLSYAVENSSNAWGSDVVSTFNMEGGTVSAPGGDAALRVYQNCASHVSPVAKNYVNITGGTILDTGIFVDSYLYTDSGMQEGFEDSIDTQISISGGTINGLIDMKIRHKNNTKLNITGGDFTNTKLWVRKYAGEYKGDEPTEPMVAISGGKFAFVTGKAFGLSYDCGATSWTSYEKPYAVSGGVFNVEVPEAFCAEGYVPAENTDAETAAAYPYTVMVAQNFVAQIVTGATTNKYASLAEAFAAAQSGETIQMIADSAETAGSTLAAGKGVVLDLNGKAVSYESAFGAAFNLIAVNGSLTVDDTSAGAAGSIALTSTANLSWDYAVNLFLVGNGGSLTIEKGSYSVTTPSYGYAEYVIAASNNSDASTVTVNGGTFTGNNIDAVVRLHDQYGRSQPLTVTVNGGDFTLNGSQCDSVIWFDVQNSGSGTDNASAASLAINGGTFTSTSSSPALDLGHSVDASGLRVMVAGGSFKSEGTVIKTRNLSAATIANIKLSGGIYSGDEYYDDLAKATVSLDTLCAAGYALADNADAETAAAYPYTVVSAVPTYEITWVSEGEILAVDVVISNTVPVYAGEPPVKDADDNGIYIFRGWTPKVEAAVSNTTYTANFSNSCTIRWMTGDTIVKSVSVTNGTPAAEIAAMAPSGAISPDGNARFAGWSPAVYADALGDADYIAQFEALDTLAGIVPGTLRFTAIKVNGRKVAVTFEFKPAGGETDAYRLICKTALDSAETFVSDIANVTLINDDANSWTAIAEVLLPEGCEARAFVTGLDFTELE